MSFKICTIGCGAISNSSHGPSYRKYKAECNDVVLAGCCDIDELRAKAYKEEFGFEEYYTDIDVMLSRRKPDAVCLTAPVHMTAKLAGKVLDMGFPLILEKPPGKTKEEVMKLIDAAESKNIPNRVAFNRRYAPVARRLRELLDADFTPGDIQSVQYDMFRINRRDDDFSTTAIHAIDTVRFITGSDYKHIDFVYREYPELGINVADIHMLCRMVSGAIVHLDICPVTGANTERAVINLYNNTFILDFIESSLILLKENKIASSFSADDLPDGKEQFEKGGFYYENMSFFNDILAGRKPKGDLRSALQSVEVADCIRKRLPAYDAY